ncbi:MAG: hypothetical protein AAF562_11845, partial [Pseudomonadota bacterium]
KAAFSPRWLRRMLRRDAVVFRFGTAMGPNPLFPHHAKMACPYRMFTAKGILAAHPRTDSVAGH